MGSSSFASVKNYTKAMRKLPDRMMERMTAVTTDEESSSSSSSSSLGVTAVRMNRGSQHDDENNISVRRKEDEGSVLGMRRRLHWLDVLAMGVGGMVGAGIFVTTGQATRLYAGPAVIVSYVVAGVSALLSALCYSEFAVHVPSAGGAFSYVRITLGEFAAYITGANLIMEYVISNAAVARSFTSYLAVVLGDTEAWRVKAPGLPPHYNMLDFPAASVVLLLTICICWSTKSSSSLNIIITILHLGVIAFVVVAGFVGGSIHNLTHSSSSNNPSGFAPFGVTGIFNGAALVYFSYIGFDAASTMAEEVDKPTKSMSVAIIGSVVLVTILYCLMAMSLVMLLPYDQVDPSAPFAIALKQKVGWGWATNVVGVGACVGILSSLLVAMLGQARYLAVIARAHIIPTCLSTIHPRTTTPLNSSLLLGGVTSVVALFTEMHVLLDLIAIGTLFVFYMVANALIMRRHVVRGTTNVWPTLGFLISVSIVSIAFVVFWQIDGDRTTDLSLALSTIILLTTIFKVMVPTVNPPSSKIWSTPSMPFLAVASIFLNIFLMGSIKKEAFLRFGIWSLLASLFYLLFSVHSTHDASNSTQLTLITHAHPLVPTPHLDINNNQHSQDMQIPSVTFSSQATPQSKP